MHRKWFLFFLVFSTFLQAAERRIALLIKPDFNGEISFAYRIQSACKNLDWAADVINIEEPDELSQNRYDFVINLVPGVYPRPNCANYLAVFNPAHHFFTRKRFLKKKYQSYDGYLLTSPLGCLRKRKSFLDQRRFPCMRWYPTVQKREFHLNPPKNLFYICCWWGNRFEEVRFRELMSALDQEPYMCFYGHPMFHRYYPKSYRGPIRYDGESLYEVAGDAGVVLVIHSSDHNKRGLPSGRIFEAAASSVVIISDENQFVKTHFGDSVLYIDTKQDAASMLNQIRSHMAWIYVNPEKAMEKAKRAHAIFEEQFLLEAQLLRLEKFHEKISKRSKKTLYSRFYNLFTR